MTARLFDVGPETAPAPLSAGAARTERDKALLAQHIHPATRRGLADNGHTCGDCAHLRYVTGNRKHYQKCAVHRLGMSHSEASDIRVGWPACLAWEATP